MYKEILLAIDVNDIDSQRKAVQTTIELARAFGARVHVHTVLPDFGMPIVASYFPADFEKKAMENAKKTLHDFVTKTFPEDLEVLQVVGQGGIYKEILKCAEQVGADLIVMASHRPGYEDYLIGPNASRVVRHAKCSVVVVRD
ncbi:MAG: universal stress protein [Kiloniellales bacterium]|nr:universal stress protein [Kiloniellales bacterium]